MSELKHPSPEVLAAFVDGRLSGEARSEMIEHLDRCRDCYEVFAETVQFQGEEAPRGKVLRPSRLGAPQWVWWTAAAAAALVVAILAPWVWDEFGPGDEDNVQLATADLASALGSAGAGSSVGASGLLPDGFGFAGAGGPRGVAVRAGVGLMDLTVAARGRELDGADEAIERLTSLLADAGLDRGLDDELETAREALAEADAQTLERAVGRLEVGVEDALDPFYLALGKWAEAGRLAAASRQAELLRSPAFVEFLDTLSDRELPPRVAEAARRVEELTGGEMGTEELRELEGVFGGLILGAI